MNSSPGQARSPESSPKTTYRMMAGMAVTLIALIGVAIYSLSRINSANQTGALADLALTTTLRQNVPHFEYSQDGKALSPQSFAGHWTLLTFWAHWCGPCLDEMPALNALAQQWQGGDFEILTVNVDDPKSDGFESARGYLSEQNIALPTVFDRNGQLKKAFEVEDLPQHFLISPDLKIVWRARGAFRWNEPKARDELMRVMGDQAFHESTEDTEATGPASDSEPTAPLVPASPSSAPAKSH